MPSSAAIRRCERAPSRLHGTQQAENDALVLVLRFQQTIHPAPLVSAVFKPFIA